MCYILRIMPVFRISVDSVPDIQDLCRIVLILKISIEAVPKTMD